MRIGQLLKSSRLAVGKTLREVERITGISNGYLSLLESDAVKQPSPKHLHKLADFYKLEYGHLMELAGYVPPRQVALVNKQGQMPSFRGLDDLTEEDKKKIQAYIEDLRDARRVRESGAKDKPKSTRLHSA